MLGGGREQYHSYMARGCDKVGTMATLYQHTLHTNDNMSFIMANSHCLYNAWNSPGCNNTTHTIQ